MHSPVFTPGPWFVDDSRGRGNNLLRVMDARGVGVANIRAILDATPNANLIAAAPDLFQTLECAKLAIERAGFDCLGWGEEPLEPLGKNIVPVAEELLKLIDGALRKARGDQ